jgi:hypothetical protein
LLALADSDSSAPGSVPDGTASDDTSLIKSMDVESLVDKALEIGRTAKS